MLHYLYAVALDICFHKLTWKSSLEFCSLGHCQTRQGNNPQVFPPIPRFKFGCSLILYMFTWIVCFFKAQSPPLVGSLAQASRGASIQKRVSQSLWLVCKALTFPVPCPPPGTLEVTGPGSPSSPGLERHIGRLQSLFSVCYATSCCPKELTCLLKSGWLLGGGFFCGFLLERVLKCWATKWIAVFVDS